MKYLRLTCLWGAILFGLSLGVSTVAPFGLSAEMPFADSMIYPTFRFYRGGAFASVTESTLSRIFADRLVGGPKGRDVPEKLAHHLYELCLRNRMDPAFVLSVIQVESSFRANAVSSAGAIGLMQIMPDTARKLRRKRVTRASLKNPFVNLELGVTYLQKLRVRYSGLSPYYALAAYNLGPHRLDQLRSKPGFKPEKTLQYYENIMRGVGDWRRYGSQALREGSTIPPRRSAVKTKPDVELKTELRSAARRVDAA
jgi:hypothetical protein